MEINITPTGTKPSLNTYTKAKTIKTLPFEFHFLEALFARSSALHWSQHVFISKKQIRSCTFDYKLTLTSSLQPLVNCNPIIAMQPQSSDENKHTLSQMGMFTVWHCAINKNLKIFPPFSVLTYLQYKHTHRSSLINWQFHRRHDSQNFEIYIVLNEALKLRLSFSEHRADSKLNCSGATHVTKSRRGLIYNEHL